MAGKRNYVDGCASAHALDLVGERWALLVVRELMLGPKRFTDLRTGLPGIGPNVLTQRLDQLEQAAVLRRRKLPPPAAAWVYELTDWGLELEPAIRALGRWGARSLALPLGTPLSIDAMILSLRTMFDPRAAPGLEGRIDLRLGGDGFRATLTAGCLELVRGSHAAADAGIEGSVAALAGVVYGGAKLADAVRSKQLSVTGDRGLVKRFLTAFPLPPRAPAGAGAGRRASMPAPTP